jgi:hypothetical protein
MECVGDGVRMVGHVAAQKLAEAFRMRWLLSAPHR